MTIRRRRRRLASQWPTILWLAFVWVLLWGELTWGNAIAGLLLAVFISIVMPLPSIEFHGRVRPLGIVKLFARFAYDLVHASIQVSMQAFNFRRTPHGAVVGVRLRSSSDLYLTLVAELSSLVPGSLVIEAHRNTGMLYLHVLDLDTYGGTEKVRRDTRELENRVLRALASDEELRLAGVAKTRRQQKLLDAELATEVTPASQATEAATTANTAAGDDETPTEVNR